MIPSSFSLLRSSLAVNKNNHRFINHYKENVHVQTRNFRWSSKFKKLDKKTLEAMKKRSEELSQLKNMRTANTKLKTLPQILDPWLPPNLYQSPFSKEYWSGVYSWGKRIVSGRFGVWYQQRQLNKYLDEESKVDRITRKEAKEMARKLYIDYYRDSTSLKIGKVDKYASDKIVQELNEKFSNTKIPYSQKVVWNVKDLKVKILNFAIGFVPPPISKDYIQVTVKFTGKQQLKVVNKEDNQIVSGSDEYIPTEEIWVIEKEFSKDSKWYINTTRADVEIEKATKILNKRV